MSTFREREILRQLLPAPNYRDGACTVFERMMRKLEMESNDKIRLEKQFGRNLRETETEKKMIEIRLRSKNREYESINHNDHRNREAIYALKKEKALLERKLEAEIMNSNRLRRQKESLRLAVKDLSSTVDHLRGEHSKELRNSYRRQYSNLYKEI